MIQDFFAFSATEVGYNHVKNGKVCEDASDFYYDDNLRICVVADGHGSDNYPRTDRGSKIAVDSSIKCVIDFVKAAEVQDVLSDEKHGFPMLLQLTKSILMDWHESVNRDFLANPFTADELSKVSTKYRKRYLSGNDAERAIEKAYGCTLLLFAVTPKYSLGIQIGDGKCVVVNRNGDFSEPIPWDENCQLNVTTSICDSDALDEFRFYVSEEAPAAVFCGSDGIDDSYANFKELHALYRSILRIFIEHGIEVGKKEIKEYLPVLTKKGSGDDVSIGLVLDISRIKKLSRIFEIQAEQFNLREKLKEKARQINSNVEKDKALSVRIKRWLDSGKRPGDTDLGDVHRVNELRTSREIVEEEILTIERRIQDLEEGLFKALDEINKSLSVDEEKQGEEMSPVNPENEICEGINDEQLESGLTEAQQERNEDEDTAERINPETESTGEEVTEPLPEDAKKSAEDISPANPENEICEGINDEQLEPGLTEAQQERNETEYTAERINPETKSTGEEVTEPLPEDAKKSAEDISPANPENEICEGIKDEQLEPGLAEEQQERNEAEGTAERINPEIESTGEEVIEPLPEDAKKSAEDISPANPEKEINEDTLVGQSEPEPMEDRREQQNKTEEVEDPADGTAHEVKSPGEEVIETMTMNEDKPIEEMSFVEPEKEIDEGVMDS